MRLISCVFLTLWLCTSTARAEDRSKLASLRVEVGDRTQSFVVESDANARYLVWKKSPEADEERRLSDEDWAYLRGRMDAVAPDGGSDCGRASGEITVGGKKRFVCLEGKSPASRDLRRLANLLAAFF